MNTNHTPGNWVARQDPHGDRNDWCIGLDDDATPVDYVAVCNECDARLIAAAPELLEALTASQKAIRELRTQGAPTAYWDDVEARNNAAIAKAIGEQA